MTITFPVIPICIMTGGITSEDWTPGCNQVSVPIIMSGSMLLRKTWTSGALFLMLWKFKMRVTNSLANTKSLIAI